MKEGISFFSVRRTDMAGFMKNDHLFNLFVRSAVKHRLYFVNNSEKKKYSDQALTQCQNDVIISIMTRCHNSIKE